MSTILHTLVNITTNPWMLHKFVYNIHHNIWMTKVWKAQKYRIKAHTSWQNLCELFYMTPSFKQTQNKRTWKISAHVRLLEIPLDWLGQFENFKIIVIVVICLVLVIERQFKQFKQTQNKRTWKISAHVRLLEIPLDWLDH